ncbi:2-hydroxyacid dehydrogenase [Vogesella alkaliphila]|uniref:Glyoxylate/hydroxypyruvate reductase A n=1 Tax=Vogesella alkaliphila TaxID=1193621 RepID=A0ABQ2YGX0_9NEIS|nr:glyoxylate/hydroxypyruvate reductase A [Vogesella alkaliphila]GGX83224.1 glyoxylate/hydroxypyruvate reductase A [Vogesella alkaliphila]
MILIHTPSSKEVAAYLELFRAALPQQRFVSLDEMTQPEAVRYVITWGPPPALFAGLPNLQAVFALGAGVDKLLARDDLSPQTPIYRLLDGGMAQQMSEYIRFGVLSYQRHMDIYRRQQAAGVWKMLAPKLPADVRVGVLGLGEIGRAVAQALAADGYTVSGWSRTPRQVPGVDCLFGDEGLDELLAGSEVLACVLPSTPQTQGLLDAQRLAALPPGAMLINAGRGDLLDEDALLALLDSGHLRCAQLDVFASEPLPHGHRLWQHPAVTVTPHIAAITLREEAVRQIAANLGRLAAGEEAQGRVVRERGY